VKLCWIWQNACIFAELLTQTYSESNSNNHVHSEFVQMKFNLGTLISSVFGADWSLGSMCPRFTESNSRLACVSAGQCLKFCDDTPSIAVLSTLNNPPDLHPDYWRLIFSSTWTPAHGSTGKKQCCMCGMLVLRSAERLSYLLSNGKCLAVILVPAVYVVTVIGTVHFSSWLHKQLLKFGKIHAFWQV